jgi:hypothetical protein
MRDVRGGVLGMEVKLDRKNSENEEEGKGHPRSHSRPFGKEKNRPETRKSEEENPPLRKKRKVQMAQVNTKGVEDEDRNERKGKGSAHLGPKRTNRVLKK